MPSRTLMAMICLDCQETFGGGRERRREMFLLVVGALAGYWVCIEATGQPSTQLETGPLLFVALDIRLAGPSF